MPSLTARRAATEAIRKHAQASLARAAGNDDKPTLSLFKPLPPPSFPTSAVPSGEVSALEPAPPSPDLAAANAEEKSANAEPPDKGPERLRWRCRLVHMFGRFYLPDRGRMKEARGFAYSRRASIHAAFDRGELKATVLESLAKAFDATTNQGVPDDA